MMERLGPYDAEIQMFTEEPKEPDMAHLESIKWSVDHGRLQGDTAPIVVFEAPTLQQKMVEATAKGDL